ncbi:HAD-like domain-containing protein [Flagelloscypha sp. PMI_526]|nr:HAD-like domain-containing protein [Flagelloscypha sp. PMI_526]
MSLSNIEVLFFDVFGTVVNWHESVSDEVTVLAEKHNVEVNSSDFAIEWRKSYFDSIKTRNAGGGGTNNTDEMMKQNLATMLASDKWSKFGSPISEEEKSNLSLVWHRLKGWPDVETGLRALKKKCLIVALSNGNLRLLIDMARFMDAPWDAVLSTELFNSFKPQPEVYLGAMKHLNVKPENCAMVACHHWDLEAAASHGMKTVYVRRDAKEPLGEPDVKNKVEGGNVDVVVDSFAELAAELLIQ